MVGRKLTLVVGLAIAVTLQCAQGQIPTSIQFSFGANLPTGDEAVALSLGGNQTVFVPVMVDIVPSTALLQSDIIVSVTVTGGTATSGADFMLVRDQVTFNIGANDGNTISASIMIQDDLPVEGPETISLTGSIVTTGTGATFVGGPATISILDNDVAIFQFNPSTYTVAEDVAGGQQAVSLQLISGTLSTNIGLQVTVTGGTATAIADFGGPNPSVVTFLVGDSPGTSRSTVFTIVNNNILEPDETILISGTTQSALGQFQAGGDTAVITITDDDVVTVQIVSMDPVSGTVGLPDVQVPENGLDPMLCAQLAGGITLARTVTVTLATVPTGTATVNQDYTPISSQIVFDPSNQNQALCRTITVIDDLICEADESFPVTLTSTENPAEVVLNPSVGSVTIIDNDVVTVGFNQTSYSVTEFQDSQLEFNVQILSGQKGPGRSCDVTISTLPDSATSPSDFIAFAPPMVHVLTGGSPIMQLSVSITEDLIFEPTEHFNLSISTTSDGCTIPDPIVDVYIMDDEDCIDETGPPCDENAECIEFPGINNFTCRCLPMFVGDGFTCRPERMIGDDPHFSIVLPTGKLLCYTVQGEHGFVFNLISNRKLSMNAMFVPDSRREEVTWLGSIGIVVWNSGYKMSNATYLRFETKGKKIYIGDKVVLEAKNIEKLSFKNGKLTISEAPPAEGFKYPSVEIDLQDVGLNFTIKFMNEHLDLFWHSTGHETKDSHGLIGQFFRKEVEIDTVRKILILPGKEPVPVMRRPVWSFMEREVADDQLCWTAMNPGYQGQGLIDGTYFDYLVNDILSTDFKFKKRQ